MSNWAAAMFATLLAAVFVADAGFSGLFAFLFGAFLAFSLATVQSAKVYERRLEAADVH